MTDENEFDEVLDRTAKANGSVGEKIGQMQQLITRGEEFKKVAKYFDTVQEWSTEEGQAFFEMMEHIKHACDSYGEVLGGARRYVICAKSFSKDTVVFITEIQEEDLEPEDIEDIVGDFKDSIDKMRESNKQVNTLKEDFKAVLGKLRDAQAEAAGGKARGKENADTANRYAGYSAIGGAAGAFGASVMTGGVAAPVLLGLGACGSVWKFSKDAEKHKEWEKTFNIVLRQLDDVFHILDSISTECTTALDELSHSSNEIMDKTKKMTSRENLKITGYIKRKCVTLKEESAKLERTCIDYIKKDDEIRGLAGAMGRLGIE
ncbi:uncharacterized protein LOC144861390 [Branchiostoma floridae x Branchiostoma japonicum]